MIKRLLVLMLPTALLAAAAVAPLSASADTFYKCPRGMNDQHYCVKVVRCVVPQLAGDTVAEASALLAAHDCALGKVKDRRDRDVAAGIVVRSDPPAGTIHRDGKKVDLQVAG